LAKAVISRKIGIERQLEIMAKKHSPRNDATSHKDMAEQPPSVRDRIQAFLNDLTDAELNILLYEIENPHERRSMEKLGRIAAARLKRPKAIKELTDMLIDYNIERHPRLETHYLTDKYHLQEYFYDYCM
jgi:hypothetical protein